LYSSVLYSGTKVANRFDISIKTGNKNNSKMGINGVLQEWIRKWVYFYNIQIYNDIYSYL